MDTTTESLFLDQLSQADIVLWFLKANQSARDIDTQFKARLDSYYQLHDNQSSKLAPIIVVLNQVDR
ncbi:hypothetical protein Q4573_24420, partial [Photobacterium sanguinicancri]|nr:hypothetical protein [Photobacterium sanguinicancri]